MRIFFKNLAGGTFSLELESTDTIESVKKAIKERQGIPVEAQRFAFGGKPLESDRTLQEYNIKTEDTIYLSVVYGKTPADE
jgi:hypothetical protein